jgi:hypothetical protein
VHQFFINILNNQPWAMGNYSDLLVKLSNVYSKLRGDVAAKKNEDAAQVSLCCHEIVGDRSWCSWLLPSMLVLLCWCHVVLYLCWILSRLLGLRFACWCGCVMLWLGCG